MNIVGDTLIQYLPSKRKTTPSGWLSFSAPCCIHNGERADTKQRGGFKQEDNVVSYHCFNCGYKASWQPGRPLSMKMRKLLSWVGASDAVINRLALDVLRYNDDAVLPNTVALMPTFDTVSLPEHSVKLSDIPDYNEHNLYFENFLAVIQYMADRNLNFDDTDFYWSPTAFYRDRLIIPFYYQGNIVGYTARTVVPGKQPK